MKRIFSKMWENLCALLSALGFLSLTEEEMERVLRAAVDLVRVTYDMSQEDAERCVGLFDFVYASLYLSGGRPGPSMVLLPFWRYNRNGVRYIFVEGKRVGDCTAEERCNPLCYA